MFQFSGYCSVYLCIQYTVSEYYSWRVSPFGYLWINTYLRFPTAFRSLSRPSSPPDAKAFPMRSLKLNLLRFSLCDRQYSFVSFFLRLFATFAVYPNLSYLTLSIFLDLALFSFQCAILHHSMWCVVEMRRIELLTPCLQGRCSPSWATPPHLLWRHWSLKIKQ